MKVIVKNNHNLDLKLLDFGNMVVKSGESVEVEANERQLKELEATPYLEIINSEKDVKKTKKKRGD